MMLESPTDIVGAYILRIALMAQSGATSRAPVGKTGNLKRSIVMTRGIPGSPSGVEITANIEYALVVHEGRGPITITPKPPKQFLKFPNKAGIMVYMPEVNQGPITGRPFLWNALQDAVASMA
jgi:hypothetical protein